MLLETIAFDFEPDAFVASCSDASGVAVELVEVSGLRAGDADRVLTALRSTLAQRFEVAPHRRRIVVWSASESLDDAAERAEVRRWLDRGVMAMQHPWKLPMVGQAAVAVLAGELPAQLRHLVVDDGVVLDPDDARPSERRRRPRTDH